MRLPHFSKVLAIALVLAMVGTAALVYVPPATSATTVYKVTFVPSGLPGGNWNVTWNGLNENAAYNANISFANTVSTAEAYTVGAYTYYTPSPASGSSGPGYPTATVVDIAWTLNVPAAPTGLSLTPISDSEVGLSWANPAGPVTGDIVKALDTATCATTIASYTSTSPITSYTLGGLKAGTEYCLLVEATNSAGSGLADSAYAFTVSLTASISASANPTDAGTSITFTPTITYGTSPYTYAWTVGGTAEGTASTLAYSFPSSGSYTVGLTVTDAASGTATASLSETVNAAMAVSATSNASTADAGFGIAFTSSATGGSGSYTYSWTLNGNVESTAASFTYAFATAGSYTMDLTVTDSVGFTDSASVSETINADPSVTATSSANPADVGYAVTFTATAAGGTGTITYAWTVGGVSAGSGATLSYSFGSTGSYTVAVTITDGDHRTATNSVTETVVANPAVSLSISPNPTDVGVAVTLSAGASSGVSPYSYAWLVNGASAGPTTDMWADTFSSAGTYTIEVTVTDADGHTVSATGDATVNGAVSASVSSSQNPTDYGKTVTFTATASGGVTPYTSYAWTAAGSSISTTCPSTSATCTFPMQGSNLPGALAIGVTVTDSVGDTYTTSLTETVNAAPSVTITGSQNPTDVGNTVTFSAATTGGTGAFTYAWSVAGAAQSSTTSQMSYTFSSTGTFKVNVTATDSVGVATSYSFTETVNADPGVTVSPSHNPTDVGVVVTFTATETGGTGTITYAWTVNSVTQGSTTSTLSWTPSSSGTYVVQITVTDAASKTASATVDETVNAVTSATISSAQNPTDSGKTVTFTATPSGGTSPYAYAWTVGGVAQSSTTSQMSYTFSSTGAITIGVTVTDSVGNSYSTTLVETVNADPTVMLTSSQNPTDVGNTATFSAATTGGTGPFTYVWTVNGAAQSSTTSQMSYTFSATGSFTIDVTATDSVAVATSYSFTETVNADPGVTVSPSHNPTDVGVAVTFTATETGGTGTITYAWTVNSVTQGSTTSTLSWTPSSGGTYAVEVTVTDGVGKVVTYTVDETVNTDPTSTLSAQYNPVDMGVADVFTPTVTGGTGPFTYSWTVGGTVVGTASTLTYSFGSTGSFSVAVTITDALGETTSQTLTVTSQKDPAVTASGPSATDVGISTGWSGAVSYGATPYTYSWTINGGSVGTAASLSYTFSSAGSYTLNLTVTDSQGTKGYWQETVVVSAQPSVSASASASAADVGTSVTFTSTVTAGTAPFTYIWTADGTQVGTSATLTWSVTATGTNTIEVEITDASGAKATSASVTVTGDSLPSLTASATHSTIDPGISDTLTATVTAGTSPFTYTWSIVSGTGGTLTGSGSSVTFSSTTAGTFKINVTVTDMDGNHATTQVTITVNAAPTVTQATNRTAYDVGSATQFTATVTNGVGPFTYAWTANGAAIGTTQIVDYTFAASGSWWINVTVTDSLGVTAKSAVDYSVAIDPTVSASASASAADVGTSVTFTSTVTAGTAPFTYIWLADGTQVGTSATLTWSVTATGANTIEVEITDASGAKATSASVTVTGNSLPSLTASATHSTIDPGISDTLTATVTAGTSPFTYTWSIVSGTGGTLTGSGSSVTFSSTTAGTFKINVTVTDTDGNHATTQITITVNAAPGVTEAANRTSLSVGVSTAFTATVTGGVGPYTYAWTVGATAIGATNPIDYTFSTAGTYWVNVTVTDSLGVTATAAVEYTVTNAPTAAIVASQTATDVGLTLSFSGTVSGGTSPYNYTWYVAGTLSGYGSAFDHLFPATGTFVVELTVRDASGLTSSTDVSVVVNPKPTATMTATYTSLDTSISDTFDTTPTGGTTPYSYAWSIYPGGAQAATTRNATFSFASPGNYMVNATITDAVGVTVKLSETVIVAANIAASITVTYSSVDVGINDTFRPVVAGGIGPYSYSWLVGGVVHTSEYLTVAFAATGTDSVQLTVADSFGHDSTVSLAVTVLADPSVTPSLVNPPVVASLNAEYHAAATGGYGAYTFTWTFPAGHQVSGAWANYTWDTAGPLAYQLYFADQGGFNETLSLTGYAHLFVSAVANTTRGPAPLTITFGASVLGGSSYAYAWNFGNGQNSAASTAQETFTAGNWTVSLVVTSANGAVGWANITIVSLPPPATVSISPTSGITVLTTVTLTATPTWVASSPETAAWTLSNGTVLHGLTVTVTFKTYSATKDVSLSFTYGANATVWSHVVVISMTPATPTAAATGVSTTIPPGTLLSVSGSPSSSPDAAIAYYNWTLSGLLYRGEVQSFYFNTTGSFALSLTVTDSLGASASTNWTIRVESAGSNSTIVIGISSVTSANVLTYTVSVSTPGGIAAADAFVDNQLLSLTLVNETLTGTLVTSANYSLSVNLGAYAAGTYTTKIVAWNVAGQSNTASTTFTDSLGGSSGGGFDLVAALGGSTNFLIIVLTAIGVVATIIGLRQRDTTDIDVDGTILQGRPGKALVIKSVPKKRKGRLP